MKNIQEEILEYLKERGWYGMQPADIAKSIIIESAELLEHFQWDNHSAETIKTNQELKKAISMELADVMIYAIELGLHLDIDIEEAVQQKLEHIRIKYPADKVSDSETGIQFYDQQKKKYRNEN